MTRERETATGTGGEPGGPGPGSSPGPGGSPPGGPGRDPRLDVDPTNLECDDLGDLKNYLNDLIAGAKSWLEDSPKWRFRQRLLIQGRIDGYNSLLGDVQHELDTRC